MKRLVVGLALSVGLLVAATIPASAASFAVYDDPNLPIGLPVHTTIHVSAMLLGLGTKVNAGTTSSNTSFGAGLSLP